MSKAYGVDDLAGGIVSTGVYLMSIAQSALLPLTGKVTGSSLKAITSGGLATVDGKGIHVTGAFMLSQLGSAGLFTAMIFGGLALVIYIWLMKANITIKMPDSVPPAVSKAFAALIPAFVAFYVFGIINYLFTTITGSVFIDWFSKVIQEPLLNASQGFGMVLLITILVQIFWFFGIHGPNVLAPVLESIWGTAQLRNIDAVAHHLSKMPYMWVRGSFDAYVWMGGSGGTIVLIIAILLFSKRSDERAVAQLSLAPGLFNINEPVMFGIPIVLNAIYFIPFILAPAVMVTIAYFATALGLVSPVRNAVIWVMPPFFNSFLATLGDWRAPILTLVNMAVAFAIWTPFVMASNKVAAEDGATKGAEDSTDSEPVKES